MTLPERAEHMAAMMGLSVLEWAPIAAESRNAVARVVLSDGRRAVLKTYEPAGDPHWANRFRREEKVLALLAAADPPVAPRVLAGWISGEGPAALLMEDAGTRCLADALLETSSVRIWNEAAEFLCTLHASMERRRLPLKRTAMAISLDRISGPVSMARFRIAARRVTGEEPEPRAVRALREAVAPLLRAPKAMIHNSMSPLNVVIGRDGWRAIDWETLAWASPVWDFAELLRAPYHALPLAAAESLAADALKLRGGEDLFRRAALSRHLDSLATVTLRRRRFEAEGRPDRAEEYARRAAFYAADLCDLLPRLDPPAPLARAVEALAGAAA